jgi:hypothetical protein
LFAAKAVSQGILMKTRIDVTLPMARPHVADPADSGNAPLAPLRPAASGAAECGATVKLSAKLSIWIGVCIDESVDSSWPRRPGGLKTACLWLSNWHQWISTY